MANDLSFTQLSTILNAIVQQATGESMPAVVNTSDFVSVGQTALKVGYDPLNTAISQVLSQTIFSTRPYYSKFKGMEVTNREWGNMARKLNMIDPDFRDTARYTLTDGQSVDQQIVCAPKVLQTNFYGANAYDLCRTIYRDQLNNAFSGPDEFARFISMVMQNASDMIDQAHESVKRATLSNFIAGIYSGGNASQIVNLITEYNGYTGETYDYDSVHAPAVYPGFIKWCFSRIAAVSSMLTERSQIYHTNVTDSPVSRHTPYDKQRVYLLAGDKYAIEAQVLADTYHDNYLRFADNETVNFWQNIRTPDSIYVKPTYLKEDGTLVTPESGISVARVFGVLMDVEACGMTVMNQWSSPAPFNARGGYTTYWWHFTDKYWNDFTENGVIFLMN